MAKVEIDRRFFVVVASSIKTPLGAAVIRPYLHHLLGGVAPMGAGMTQQGLQLRRSLGSAAQRRADNDLLHVHHYDCGSNESAPASALSAEVNLPQALRRSSETTSPGC